MLVICILREGLYMPEGINLFQDTLIKSLKFGFVDNIKYQDGGYSPQILVNNSDEKRYVLTDLQKELSKCAAFYFSVAFVTKNGIAMIKSQLSDLMDKKVPGKILISPYLDFNDPDAMRELLKLKNVEVRLTPEKIQMHAKFYLFEHTGKQVLISGSSNLTHTSLKINYEWNIKLTSTHNGEFVQNTKSEFDRIWEQSELLTPEIIETYAKRERKSLVSQRLMMKKSSLIQLKKLFLIKCKKPHLKGSEIFGNREKTGHLLSVPQVLVRHFYLPLTLNNIILSACYSSSIVNRFSKNL